MMEVVISFANGHQCSDDIIPWTVFVVKRTVAEVMGEGVDRES